MPHHLPLACLENAVTSSPLEEDEVEGKDEPDERPFLDVDIPSSASIGQDTGFVGDAIIFARFC